jgi:hypothetical protein
MSDIRELLLPQADANAAISEMVQRLNACLRTVEAEAEKAAEEQAARAALRSATSSSAASSRLRAVGQSAEKSGRHPVVAQPATGPQTQKTSPDQTAPAAGSAGSGAAGAAGEGPEREAIAFFGNILQTMPDDRVSLEVLTQAYAQVGELARSHECLVRLADVMVRERDHDGCEHVRELLRRQAGSAASVDAALNRVVAFLGGSGSAPARAAENAPVAPRSVARAAAAAVRKANPLSDAGRRRTIISEEMNLAWDLQQGGVLSEEHYAAVVRDLTDLSSSEVPVTISALHALQFRNFANVEQVLLYVSGKSETPIIPLASFDPQGTAFSALPIEYMVVQGVIPFECLGPDLLVALLNPLNERVRREVQELVGQRCHFFLVSPSEFDTTMETIKNRYPAVATLRKQQAEP